ncbi:MAG: diaminopimelate epimerase [Candidatus Hydrogenedentota bacterium]
MNLEFIKMTGAGNDFIMIDNRYLKIANPSQLAVTLCPRGTSVGADGIILIENSKDYDFKMRIINSDGSEAEMCGNGARCAVNFAKILNIIKSDSTSFETLAGDIKGWIINDRETRITLPLLSSVKLNQKLIIDNTEYLYHFANVGVPHTVVFVDELDSINVNEIGKKIRFHTDFKPTGTNADFVKICNKNNISIRTYERGVEKETLACGTGATAAAIISIFLNKTKSPVDVITRSGLILKINCKIVNNKIDLLTIQGESRVVYKGYSVIAL